MDHLQTIISQALSAQSIISAILTGIISSFVIFLVLSIFRPRIRISKQIAQHVHRDRGDIVYTIKIHNRSPLKLIDIKVEAMLIECLPHNGSSILRVKELEFTRNNFIRLYGMNPSDKEGKFACRLSIVDNLTDLWVSSSQHLEFIVSARHPWSGINRWFIRKYYLKTGVIVEGEFEVRRSLDIMPLKSGRDLPSAKINNPLKTSA